MSKRSSRASARSISFDEFTEATFSAVLRATAARKLPHGPIIVGIVYWPELKPPSGIAGAGITKR
jgi:hypothetical protein